MQNPRMLFISSFTIPEQSGSGIHAFRFCRFLVRSGYKAYMLSFNRNFKHSPKKVVDGVNIIRIPYLNKNFLLKIFSLPVILSYYLVHLIKTNVVYIYGNKIIGYQILILLAYLLKKKIIFRSLLTGIDDLHTIKHSKYWLARSFNRFVFNRLTIYHAINNIFIKSFDLCNFKEVKLLGKTQGVDLQYFKPVTKENKQFLRKNYNIPVNKFVIIVPAVLIARKGFEELFLAMSKLDMDFLLLIVGLNKPEKNFLNSKELKEMSLLKEQGNRLLKGKIIFINPVKEINVFMQMADLLVLNSKNEGMPNVILEAMASGLPVLWKRLPGISDVIIRNDLNGFIYSTIDEFQNKISFILKNKNILTEIGVNARKFAEKELSFEILFKNLMKLL